MTTFPGAMVKILLATLFLGWLACIPGAHAQGKSPKGKLFIIGGGEKPPEMISRIIMESAMDQDDYAVILPMSSTQPDSSAYYVKTLFDEAGLHSIFSLQCNRLNADSAVKADSIREAKLIYITGGDQSIFMDIVEGSAVEKAIREAYYTGALIAGTSAGAALMSKIMITGNQIKYPDYASTFSVIESDNIETRSGLGLLPGIIIDQHFLIRSRHNRLLTAIITHPYMIGIGIDESTAILVKDNTAEVIGLSQVFMYRNKSRGMYTSMEKLGAKNIRLDVYLPGETFRVKQK